MTEKRYMSYYGEVLDSWFGYDGNNEPTEREIKEKDYLVIGECNTTDDADNVCKRLNELQKENEQLKQKNRELERVVDLLNENEQLKRKNKGLQSELHIFKEDVTHSNKIIDKLNDENRQLKEEIKDLNDVLARYEEKELEYD